jgi:cardiolipin synthase
MLTLFFVIIHVVGFFSSIDAIMGTRTAQGAIAWALSLNLLPAIAVPAYWVLGRSRFKGYVSLRQSRDKEIQHQAEILRERLENHRYTQFRVPESGRAAESLAGFPFVGENDVELLIDGEATFDSILAGMAKARSYILIQFYIVHDDRIGRAIQSCLIERAKQGVRVFFLYDELGSHDLTDAYKNELEAAGAEIRPFNTRKGPGNRFQINFRNHRKNVIVDGRVAWVGGHNVGDEYLGRDPKIGHWRDTHVRIEGPAAVGAQLSFVEDWYWATNRHLEVDWTMYAAEGGEANVLVMPTGPADELESAALMYTHAINTAAKRIWIASPYFVPDEGVVHALQLAALRGVDIRLLIPDKSDNRMVDLAAASYFDDLANVGAKFYRYTDGFLHEKTMIVDDLAATVGTANFDNRSFRLNFEITAIIAEPGFIEEMEKMFEADFEKSRLMRAGEYDYKSFWFRFAVRLSSLSAPIQ